MSQQTFNNPVIIYPILDGDVSSGAGIKANKLQQQRHILEDFTQQRTDTPSAAHHTSFVATSSGTLLAFSAGLAVTGSATDIDFDLLVNGSSVLTAAVNITDSETDDTLSSGVISSTAISAGDVVSIQMTVTTNTGAQGPMCQLFWNENPQ